MQTDPMLLDVYFRLPIVQFQDQINTVNPVFEIEGTGKEMKLLISEIAEAALSVGTVCRPSKSIPSLL